MRKIDDIDLTKYDSHQLTAVAEIFDTVMSDDEPGRADRNDMDFGGWVTTELDLELAAKQAQQYAKATNQNRKYRSDYGSTEAEKEISKSTMDWLKRKKRGRNSI